VSDLLFSNDFQEYRLLELEAAARIVFGMNKGLYPPEYCRGALDLLKAIVKIPEAMAKTNEQKAVASQMIEKALKTFEVKYVRAALED
jgi:hypothetical protein